MGIISFVNQKDCVVRPLFDYSCPVSFNLFKVFFSLQIIAPSDSKLCQFAAVLN